MSMWRSPGRDSQQGGIVRHRAARGAPRDLESSSSSHQSQSSQQSSQGSVSSLGSVNNRLSRCSFTAGRAERVTGGEPRGASSRNAEKRLPFQPSVRKLVELPPPVIPRRDIAPGDGTNRFPNYSPKADWKKEAIMNGVPEHVVDRCVCLRYATPLSADVQTGVNKLTDDVLNLTNTLDDLVKDSDTEKDKMKAGRGLLAGCADRGKSLPRSLCVQARSASNAC